MGGVVDLSLLSHPMLSYLGNMLSYLDKHCDTCRALAALLRRSSTTQRARYAVRRTLSHPGIEHDLVSGKRVLDGALHSDHAVAAVDSTTVRQYDSTTVPRYVYCLSFRPKFSSFQNIF